MVHDANIIVKVRCEVNIVFVPTLVLERAVFILRAALSMFNVQLTTRGVGGCATRGRNDHCDLSWDHLRMIAIPLYL
jgi:hypothetical protein